MIISGGFARLLLILLGIVGAYFIPGTVDYAKSFYITYLSEFVTIVLESSSEEFNKVYKFGLRILGLFSGWFVLLFVFESALGLVIRIFVWIIRRLFGSAKTKQERVDFVTEPGIESSE